MTVQRQTGEFNLAAAIRRYFDVALYLLIFTGFGTLASTGRLDLPTVVLVSCGLLFRGYILSRRRDVLLSERWTNLLTIACVAFFIADAFVISRAFLGATVHLVLFVMLVRLFSAQRDRDHYFLAVLSFLMVLAAAVLTVDSTFLFALAGFILLAVAALILMEMMHSLQKAAVLARDSYMQDPHRKLSFAIAGISPVLLALILACGAGIFFLLPRISVGFMSSQAGSNEITTGFSDRVDLGRIGEIQQSKAVLMHMQIDGDTFGAFAPKLRGITLTTFDGHTWSHVSGKRTLTRGPDGRFSLNLRAPSPISTSRGIHYRVTMEPFVSEVFFLLEKPRSLEGNYRVVAEDADADVFDVDPEHPVRRYEADSDIGPGAAPRANRADDHPDHLRSYLQLPRFDPCIRFLVESITVNVTNSFACVAALESYLRSHY